MDQKFAVIAIGGNSLIKDPQKTSVQDQYEAAKETCKYLADLVEHGWRLVITHGNGPQVGFILLRSELSKHVLHEVPLDSCGADTQGAIGYHLQQNMRNELLARNINKTVATVVTQVIVDENDPSFANPSKPVGPFYTKQQALQYAKTKGWDVAEDAGRGWRRVVASPKPVKIVELEAIRTLVANGIITIAVGGGGIPVVQENNTLKGVAAVIDKDRASALLATKLAATHFIISTAVDKVYLNFGKPNQQPIDVMSSTEAKRFLKQGHFKPGSMKPKIEAAIQFLESGGKKVIITCPDKLLAAARGQAGTHINP